MPAQEIEFSIMSPDESAIRPLLDQFEAEQHVHVRLKLLSWDTAWSELVKIAIYNDGPDLSEIGNTWTGDLIGMNALRPFSTAETATFGKAAAFLPSAWEQGANKSGGDVWSIPWLAGARTVFYRPALLERAGIDPSDGFANIDSFEKTIAKLQAAGVQVPWIAPTRPTHTTLLNVASWVWAAGGNFLSLDGKTTRFLEPEAMEGITAYYRLGRYLAPEVRVMEGTEIEPLFLSNPKTAVTISGTWLRQQASRTGMLGELRAALPPGPSFVGGSNLVIWKHTHSAEAAIRLVRFLTETEAQVSYSQQAGLLPVRLDALRSEPFTSDPIWQAAVQGLSSGRSFPVMRLWGLVEDRLTAAFAAIWSDWLANEQADLTAVVHKHLTPLARRLDTLLTNQ